MDTNVIHTGDAFDVLPTLPADSAHAVVTDPPYGLAFMGRDWDDFEPKEYQEWCEEWAAAVKRVLKPGGHLLAFSGNRTHHRLFSGVEDAGFEIRDTITWHYGSGFPKALDVSKAIQKSNGVEPESVDPAEGVGFMNSSGEWNDTHNQHTMPDPDGEAAEWDGFKTALKPATEYVVVARKPLGESTVAENVQEYGTGALNIDGTRISTDDSLDGGATSDTDRETQYGDATGVFAAGSNGDVEASDARYPSNVVFDATEAKRLDREVGTLSSGTVKDTHDVQADTAQNCYGDYGSRDASDIDTIGDSGGPSRYFYTSKASRAERTLDGRIDNAHPTVKPADLMEWLVTLVTAEEQIVLDPFAGTGTTCRAAKDMNRRFVGIERQDRWADVARARVGLSPEDPSHLRGNDAQSGLADW